MGELQLFRNTILQFYKSLFESSTGNIAPAEEQYCASKRVKCGCVWTASVGGAPEPLKAASLNIACLFVCLGDLIVRADDTQLTCLAVYQR